MGKKARELKTREEWEEVLQSIDTVLFDCDGNIINAIPHTHTLSLSLYYTPPPQVSCGLEMGNQYQGHMMLCNFFALK